MQVWQVTTDGMKKKNRVKKPHVRDQLSRDDLWHHRYDRHTGIWIFIKNHIKDLSETICGKKVNPKKYAIYLHITHTLVIKNIYIYKIK